MRYKLNWTILRWELLPDTPIIKSPIYIPPKVSIHNISTRNLKTNLSETHFVIVSHNFPESHKLLAIFLRSWQVLPDSRSNRHFLRTETCTKLYIIHQSDYIRELVTKIHRVLQSTRDFQTRIISAERALCRYLYNKFSRSIYTHHKPISVCICNDRIPRWQKEV